MGYLKYPIKLDTLIFWGISSSIPGLLYRLPFGLPSSFPNLKKTPSKNS